MPQPIRTLAPFGAFALSLALAATPLPARAEAPMNVDDAGTVGRGGVEVEFSGSRDDETRGIEGGVGYGLTDALQIGVALAKAKDRSGSPDIDLEAVGVSFKWIPLVNEVGLNAGLALDFARAQADAGRVDEEADSRALTALASWAFESGVNLHLNVAREWIEIDGETEAENAWGLGADYPLGERFEIAGEVFGAQHGRPDRALGVRYTIRDGFKVSALAGRGNDRSFYTVAALLEF